ncbi:MAG: hypothetical protein E4H14_16340 [Candidatus Thorarchaeota archaeon]|nr:MAG: hypothetical protein E4H14_16340 [Candidatus Thorarchaeota archaeon]
MEEFIKNSRVYAIAAWIVVPIVIVIIETLWTLYISNLLDAVISNVLRSFLLFFLLIIVTNMTFKRLVPRYKRGRMLTVGFLWLLFFLVFDMAFRYYVLNLNLEVIIQDYNLLTGGFRGLVLLVMFFGPLFMVRTHIGDPNLFEMPFGKMATIGLLPSSLKIAYYRRKGAEIGEGVTIGPLSILDCEKIVIGDHVEIGPANIIRANEFTIGRYSTTDYLVIIDTPKVVIGEEVTIQGQVYIGGLKTDKSYFEIGDLSMIFTQSVINPTWPIKIGKRTAIGGANLLFTHGTWQPMLDGFPVAFGPITIEDGVWLPWRVFILPGVHIGKQATIGGGSLIHSDIPARSLAVGRPARVIKTEDEYIKKYTDEEKRDILKDMLTELVGYLRIEGWKATDPILDEAYAKTTFRTPRGPSSKQDNHVIFMFEDKSEYWDLVEQRTFVIALFPIDQERISNLERAGSWWFDLSNSTWGGTRINVSLMVNAWLSRYGHWMKYTS